jgi:predicted acylesterase/phospholipase RssA
MLVQDEKKIGYALGGGAARGLFHIGVLAVLEEYNIYPDIIAGTSMGSIIGALYASGLTAAEIKQIAIELDWKRLIRLADITLPLSGLIQGKRIISLLKSILRDRTFSQLKKKFACVATDLMNGEQVVLQEGSLIEAIRASISIPAIFTPVKLKGHYLIDGGLANVVPVSVCRDMGADFVIGVNVIPRPGEKVSIQQVCEKYHSYQLQYKAGHKVKSPSLAKRRAKYRSYISDIEKAAKKFLLYRPSKRNNDIEKPTDPIVDNGIGSLFSREPRLYDVLSQTLSIVEYRIAMENLKEADLAITPFNGNVGFWQFNRATEAINAGEIAARLALQRDDIARIMLNRQQSTISRLARRP